MNPYQVPSSPVKTREEMTDEEWRTFVLTDPSAPFADRMAEKHPRAFKAVVLGSTALLFSGAIALYLNT